MAEPWILPRDEGSIPSLPSKNILKDAEMKKPTKLMNFLVRNQFIFNKSDKRSSYYKNSNFAYTIRISDHIGKTITLEGDRYITIIPQDNDQYIFIIGRVTKTFNYKELTKLLSCLFCVYDFIPEHFKFITDILKAKEKSEAELNGKLEALAQEKNLVDMKRRREIGEIKLELNKLSTFIGEKLK
jgi:hypothetical protein